jgi:hypothetical protein
MARKYENSKNIPVIEMTLEEASNIGFSPMCDNCKDISLDKNSIRYFVPVREGLLCSKCYENFINNSNTKQYNKDNYYKKVHFNYYAEKLNIPTI